MNQAGNNRPPQHVCHRKDSGNGVIPVQSGGVVLPADRKDGKGHMVKNAAKQWGRLGLLLLFLLGSGVMTHWAQDLRIATIEARPWLLGAALLSIGFGAVLGMPLVVLSLRPLFSDQTGTGHQCGHLVALRSAQ